MNKNFKSLYKAYAEGKKYCGLQFRRHRTKQAFTLANERGVLAAWKKACSDNANAGNSLLPAFLKAFFEVVGVVLVALIGISASKNKHFGLSAIMQIAVLLFSQTLSESAEERRSNQLGKTFDSIADETELPPGFVWPDCSCNCGCTGTAALPSGGMCTNCIMGYHG